MIEEKEIAASPVDTVRDRIEGYYEKAMGAVRFFQHHAARFMPIMDQVSIIELNLRFIKIETATLIEAIKFYEEKHMQDFDKIYELKQRIKELENDCSK